MRKELYSRTIIPASQAHDGETPTRIVVTKERNCHLVWYDGFDQSYVLTSYPTWGRNDAIEFAVHWKG